MAHSTTFLTGVLAMHCSSVLFERFLHQRHQRAVLAGIHIERDSGRIGF